MRICWLLGWRLALGLLIAGVLASCSVEARKARHLAHGEDYFKSGDYEKAKIEYVKLLLVDPRNELAYERLGFIWTEEGAPLRAAPFLLKARELAPTNVANRLVLARAFTALGRTADARKEVLAALEQSPEEQEAIVLLADTDQTRSDVDYTEDYLRKLSARDTLSVQLALGNVAVQKGDFATGTNLLEHAANLDPKSALPHLALANLHVYQQRLAEAEKEFKTAVELDPIRSGTRLRYAKFKMINGQGNDAIEFLLQTVRDAPDYLPGWCCLAEIALYNRQYDETLRLLENVFSRDPQNPLARILEAETFLAKGDPKKAVERFEDLAKTYKDVPIINYELARAYLQNNNPGQASVALTHAISAKPDYLDAILLRGELDLQSGNASLVVPGMINILKQQPHVRQAELLLIEAYLSLGRFEEAAGVIKEQIRFSPDDADAYYRLGLVLREQKKLDDAKAAFMKVGELVPGNLKAVNQLVDIEVAQKNFGSAMSRVQREFQKQPKSPIAYFMEGRIYAAQNRFDLAEESLTKALVIDSNSLGAYQLLISTYLNDNKPEAAVTYLKKLLSLDPHQSWALSTLASTYARLGDFDNSRDTYEKLLSETPGSAEVMIKLAALYIDQFDQLNKAYELASKARALAPVDPIIADTLGWICYKQGNYQQALELNREAAAKLPHNPEVQFHLGMANYAMDQAAEARVAFKKAVAAGSDFPHRDEASRWLALIGDDTGPTKQSSVSELETLVESRPKDVVVRNQLAATYQAQGAFSKAAAQYESVLSINPKLGDSALHLAELYSGPLHNLNRAMEMAKSARDLAKNNPKTGRILGKIAYQTANYGWAYDLLSQASHDDRQDSEIAYDLGWAAYSLGKINEAQQAIRRAVELHLPPPQSDEARRFLDFAIVEQNNSAVSIPETKIEAALKIDPQYVPALMAKAALLMQGGDSAGAIDAYNTVLQRFPDFVPAEKALAHLFLASTTNVDKAYELAVKAHNSLPEDVEATQMLAEVTYSRKDYAYAVQLLREVSRRKSLDARALYYLGMSYLATQDENEGYNALNRSLTAGLGEPFASEAKRVLADLEQKRRKNS